MNPLHWKVKRGQVRRRQRACALWLFQVSTFRISKKSVAVNAGISHALNLFGSIVFLSIGFFVGLGFAGSAAAFGLGLSAGLLSAGLAAADLLSSGLSSTTPVSGDSGIS